MLVGGWCGQESRGVYMLAMEEKRVAVLIGVERGWELYGALVI
jgi:hypothetical protein